MASTSHPRGYIDFIAYMVVFMIATDTTTVYATCGRALGMTSGDIKNDQVTASTRYDAIHEDPWYAYYARIGNKYAWYPSTDNADQWLQVDLRKQMVITGVETQGHFWGSKSYYVETFMLQYKVEPSLNSGWQDAFDGKGFQGNRGANVVKFNNFTRPIVASAIRFLPQSWHEGIALRVEILGCDLSDITCGEPPSIPNAIIITNNSDNSFGEWRKYECAAGFTSDVSEYHLICGINGTWYWTNGAPDCSKIPTRTTSTRPPVTTVPSSATTVPSVTSTKKSPSNISAGLSSIIPIAAGAGGGLVLLVVIVVIVIVCRKRRDRSDTVKLDDLQTPPASVRTEDRPEDVTFVHNDMYESVDNTGTTGHRLGEHPEEVGFVRNDMYESVNRTGEDSSNVTLLPASEGAAALYSVVDKKPCGADDEGMVDNIIYG
ncbi:discoidin, CUB and LCCL domain-containing protein 2-like isoform X2 [Branchiostoma lanceolatum]|uniref:discoidin, CUB and LCCL domain-containing protein 2-like isoform X2 n=1 Tax=Branchiostoma lanceolatum TaxID=7740 RepID=UPI0034538182